MIALRNPGNIFVCLYCAWCFRVLCGYNVTRPEADKLILNGKWTLKNSNGTLSLTATVPGCVHSALLQQGMIKDPYFRFNDVAYKWIALENWTYTTTFLVPPSLRAKQEVHLVFEGVDTVASITVNGITVGKTDNMFRRYDLRVSEVLLEGENVLEVRLLSPVLYAAGRSQASAYRVPPDCPPEVQQGECHVNFIRKAQSSFSWDWGPSLPTLGLWKEVRLEAYDVLRLVHLSSVPVYDASLSQWTVEVELCVDAAEALKGNVTLSLPELGTMQEFPAVFSAGHAKSTFVLHLERSKEVKLWWPNGHGGQPSYLLSVAGLLGSLSLRADTQVYFRTVELVQEPITGSPGLSFYFRVNRKPIFLKGSNWIPAHALQDRVTPAVIKNLLQSAVDANMNAVRVWGGGVYEQDVFYSTCDELGVMVWQDFMFACALYPMEPDFIQTVREEVLQQVRRLKSHPSIIVWSGNNENEAALATDWFGIPASQRPRYLRDYVSLYVDNIRAMVLEEDRSRPFLVSSPTNAAESQQEGWVAADPYDPRYGDTHYYSYTQDCWDWRTFPRTRFASEYGFQSWPSFSTLQEASVAEDWSYHSRFSSHRQHHDGGNQQMLQQAALHFHLPNSSDPPRNYRHTLYLTQVTQAQCVKTQTEFYRRSRSEIVEGKGHTMGALYWQLNDIWQAPSWSSIDFSSKWKMLHYFAQGFFAPVVAVGFEDEGALIIYAVSDLSTDLLLHAVVSVYAWSSQDPVCALKSSPALVRGGSASAIFKQPIAGLLAGCGRCSRLSCLVTFQLQDARGPQGPLNYLFLSSPKDALCLQAPNITAVVQQDREGFVVTLRSLAVAPYVWLDVGAILGRFSSNGFLMVTRETVVHFFPWEPTSAADLARALVITTLRDLY
ncbi:beta-mannosidase [Hypomesus transpacificus]|uniref:beta-mannosidase n=1 Tax=Hypomesus transpacificus TaxID=137520 RepID=UPI001F07B785|nr:beta-mannosidase [Hypomesus transpacificus]